MVFLCLFLNKIKKRMEGNMAFLTDRSQEKEKKKTQVST